MISHEATWFDLVLTSDVSIVFRRPTFNTLSTRQTAGTLVLNTINKNISESLQSLSLDFLTAYKSPGLGSVDFLDVFVDFYLSILFKKVTNLDFF